MELTETAKHVNKNNSHAVLKKRLYETEITTKESF